MLELEGICVNARNWVDSAQDGDNWRALVMCGYPPTSHSDRVLLFHTKIAG